MYQRYAITTQCRHLISRRCKGLAGAKRCLFCKEPFAPDRHILHRWDTLMIAHVFAPSGISVFEVLPGGSMHGKASIRSCCARRMLARKTVTWLSPLRVYVTLACKVLPQSDLYSQQRAGLRSLGLQISRLRLKRRSFINVQMRGSPCRGVVRGVRRQRLPDVVMLRPKCTLNGCGADKSGSSCWLEWQSLHIFEAISCLCGAKFGERFSYYPNSFTPIPYC